MDEFLLVEDILKKAVEWEQEAISLLHNAEYFWKIDSIGEDISNSFICELEQQVHLMDSAMKACSSLGLKFSLIPKLEDTCSNIKWCIKALSFPATVPTREVIYIFSI